MEDDAELGAAVASLGLTTSEAISEAPSDVLLTTLHRLLGAQLSRWTVQAVLRLGQELSARDALSDALAPSSAVLQRTVALARDPSKLRGDDAAVFEELGAWPDVVGILGEHPAADAALADALRDRRVALGFRARLDEFREIDLSRPSATIDRLGRRTLLRLALEFLADSFPSGGSIAEVRPIAERLTSLAVAHHARDEERAALEARFFAGAVP
jgi:hypothetical protein